MEKYIIGDLGRIVMLLTESEKARLFERLEDPDRQDDDHDGGSECHCFESAKGLSTLVRAQNTKS